MQQMMQQQQMAQNILPPQQVLTASGDDSVRQLKMSPNSSVFVAHETENVLWKCVSDSLGNVTVQAFNVFPRQDPQQAEANRMEALMSELNVGIKNMNAFLAEFVSPKAEPVNNDAKVKETEAKQSEPITRSKSSKY